MLEDAVPVASSAPTVEVASKKRKRQEVSDDEDSISTGSFHKNPIHDEVDKYC